MSLNLFTKHHLEMMCWLRFKAGIMALYEQNLGNVVSDPWFQWAFQTHPSLAERIQHMNTLWSAEQFISISSIYLPAIVQLSAQQKAIVDYDIYPEPLITKNLHFNVYVRDRKYQLVSSSDMYFCLPLQLRC